MFTAKQKILQLLSEDFDFAIVKFQYIAHAQESGLQVLKR